MRRSVLLVSLFITALAMSGQDSAKVVSNPKPYFMVRGGFLASQPDYLRTTQDAYVIQATGGIGVRFNRNINLGFHTGLLMSYIAPLIPLTGEISIEFGKGRFAPVWFFQAGGVVPVRRMQEPEEGNPWGWGQTFEARGGGFVASGVGLSIRRANRESMHFTAGYQGYKTEFVTRWGSGSDRQIYSINRWAFQASWFFW
jgi:hypothetical protein